MVDAFVQSLARIIEEQNLFGSDSRIVAGVSGGADSMALLYGLAALNDAADWHLDIHVACLDHGLRGEHAERDVAFVRDHAGRLGLEFHTASADTFQEASSNQATIEEAARCVRYEFLERIARETDADCVAVGHHAQDQAETILHRICRGTGWRGVCGMSPRRPLHGDASRWLVRPLLGFSPDELREYLRRIQVDFREDETNTSCHMTRNRIRQTVMPILKQNINPSVEEALVRLGTQAGWVDSFIQTHVREAMNEARTPQGLSIDKLANLELIICSEVIRLTLRELNTGEKAFRFSHVQKLMEMLSADRGEERMLDFPYGIRARLSGGLLRFEQGTFEQVTWEPQELPCPGSLMLEEAGFVLICELHESIPDAWDESPVIEWLDYDAIAFPLSVRPRREGDRMKPLGMDGAKKITDILQQGGVPASERDRTPIVCDGNGPVWVVGHRLANRVRIRENTAKAVKIYAEPIGEQ